MQQENARWSFRAGLLERDAYLGLVLPGDAARACVFLRPDQEVEPLGNADRAGELEAGARGREVAHGAVDHAVAVIEYDLAGLERAKAWVSLAFRHGVAPWARRHSPPQRLQNVFRATGAR